MESKYQKYLNTYAGSNLSHTLDTEGLWEVLGEDPNCDFGGSHHRPSLGVYHGTLGAVIEMAVELPDFWTWGAGGDFKLIKVQTLDNSKVLTRLFKEKTELEEKLAAVNAKLKNA